MSFTYSIACSITTGIVSYPLVKVAASEYDDISTGQWALAVTSALYFVVHISGMLQVQI